MQLSTTGANRAVGVTGWSEVMGANCVGSRSEVGCLRFDILRASTESDLFVSYEAPLFLWLCFFWKSCDLLNILFALHLECKDTLMKHMSTKTICSGIWDKQKSYKSPADSDSDWKILRVSIRLYTYRFSGQNLLLTSQAFESPAAMDVHKEMPYTKAWGAFQYGDSWVYSCYTHIHILNIPQL